MTAPESGPTLLAGREALADFLHLLRHQGFACSDSRDCWEWDKAAEHADALLASGVVRDVAGLAQDEALVERVLGFAPYTTIGTIPSRGTIRQVLLGLAAALGGARSTRPECECGAANLDECVCGFNGWPR